jgi:hypothetical protein
MREIQMVRRNSLNMQSHSSCRFDGIQLILGILEAHSLPQNFRIPSLHGTRLRTT